MGFVNLLAGIAWDPELRGLLAVIVGTVVLMGSVYLLLGTNVGNRLGFLLALTAFFGWMIIHGLVWWIYPPGNGPGGRLPAWEVEEVNHGDLEMAALNQARNIDTSGLPDPEELREMTPEEVAEISDENAEALDGWTIVAESDPGRGEMQVATDTMFTEGQVPGIDAASDYVPLYVLEKGGKPERESDSVVDRVTNKITNSLRPTHPPHYSIVMVQPARQEEPVPGEPPPTPEPDPDAEVLNVVMIRDLGQRRLPAALVTVGSALIFGVLAYMLHVRDRRVVKHLSAPVPATTGA